MYGSYQKVNSRAYLKKIIDKNEKPDKSLTKNAEGLININNAVVWKFSIGPYTDGFPSTSDSYVRTKGIIFTLKARHRS